MLKRFLLVVVSTASFYSGFWYPCSFRYDGFCFFIFIWIELVTLILFNIEVKLRGFQDRDIGWA